MHFFHGSPQLPGLVNVNKKTMENHHAINGKIHYFDWAIFNSKLFVYQRVHGQVLAARTLLWWDRSPYLVNLVPSFMDFYGTYGDFDGLTWLIGDFRAGFYGHLQGKRCIHLQHWGDLAWFHHHNLGLNHQKWGYFMMASSFKPWRWLTNIFTVIYYNLWITICWYRNILLWFPWRCKWNGDATGLI